MSLRILIRPVIPGMLYPTLAGGTVKRRSQQTDEDDDGTSKTSRHPLLGGEVKSRDSRG